MSILFRRSIRIGKFTKINFTKNGLSSVSFGIRGARIGVNSRGTYIGTSIPGGLSAHHYLNSGSKNNSGYQATIENTYLGIQKIIKGTTEDEVREKAVKQIEIWERKEERGRKKDAFTDLQKQFEEESSELEKQITSYSNILKHTLSVDDKIDWESNKMPEKFEKTLYKENYFYNVPKESFLDTIFFWRKSKRLKILAESEHEFAKAQYKFDKEKADYENEAKTYNQELFEFKKAFELDDEEAVIEYVTKVLNDSEYLPDIVRDFELNYNKESKSLLIDYVLPSPDDVPNTKELKFVKTAKEIRNVPFKKGEFESFYDAIISQIALRTLHEIFESVYTNAIDTIIFNGMIIMTDKTTGQTIEPYILSILTNRKQFEAINLSKIDPIACLNSLEVKMVLPFKKLESITTIGSIE